MSNWGAGLRRRWQSSGKEVQEGGSAVSASPRDQDPPSSRGEVQDRGQAYQGVLWTGCVLAATHNAASATAQTARSGPGSGTGTWIRPSPATAVPFVDATEKSTPCAFCAGARSYSTSNAKGSGIRVAEADFEPHAAGIRTRAPRRRVENIQPGPARQLVGPDCVRRVGIESAFREVWS